MILNKGVCVIYVDHYILKLLKHRVLGIGRCLLGHVQTIERVDCKLFNARMYHDQS